MRETRRSQTTENDSYSLSLRLPLPQALDWGSASLRTHRSRRRILLQSSPLNSDKQGWAHLWLELSKWGKMKGYQGRLWFCSGWHFNIGQVLIKERLITKCKFISTHLRKTLIQNNSKLIELHQTTIYLVFKFINHVRVHPLMTVNTANRSVLHSTEVCTLYPQFA
jgi:hypothetical protein